MTIPTLSTSGNEHRRIISERLNALLDGYDSTKIFGLTADSEVSFWGADPTAQLDTSVASATFTQNSGNAINEASTFDGYTIKQIVKALRTMGLLA